jgi:hypothetical protein
VPGKPLAGKTGQNHPAWKGGFQIDRDGYIRTYAPDHPWPRKGGYVLEHVRLMEIHLGRRMKKGEEVHHVDRIKTHNVLSNLEVLKKSEHSHLHAVENAPRRERDSHGRFTAKTG